MKFKRVSLAVLILFLVSCRSTGSPDLQMDVPVHSTDEPAVVQAAHTSGEDTIAFGEYAFVDNVAVVYPSTWPKEIQIVIDGNLPDGCTDIVDLTHALQGNEIVVKIITSRPADVDCTMALEPFSRTMTLDLRVLADGEYRVVVYDHVVNFEIGVIKEPEEQRG